MVSSFTYQEDQMLISDQHGDQESGNGEAQDNFQLGTTLQAAELGRLQQPILDQSLQPLGGSISPVLEKTLTVALETSQFAIEEEQIPVGDAKEVLNMPTHSSSTTIDFGQYSSNFAWLGYTTRKQQTFDFSSLNHYSQKKYISNFI